MSDPMSTDLPDDPRIDRLYHRLPMIYRMRDAQQGYPLQGLLRVISEQVNLVEDDIARLYDNWFVETADDWAVPYIADLVGYRPVHEAGPPARSLDEAGRARNRVLIPRREVANLIRYRRRKGTLALLEQLANDVAGWPARAVEFFKLLNWAQNLNHPHFDRLGTADLRGMDALDLVDGPFDRLSHSVDIRRINSRRRQGRYNIPGVGVFVWRLRSYPVTATPACCVDDSGPHCYTFSVLGQDAPLYVRPEPETEPTHIAEELNLPAPIRRRAFEQRVADYYGAGKSLAIWADNWAGYEAGQPLPAAALIVADLSGWQYAPPRKHVAVDPVLGRLAFPPSQLPKQGVRVSYRYGFSADLGGGEYRRPLLQPAGAFKLYRVGEDEAYAQIGDALRQWRQDAPQDAVIELAHSGVWVEPINIQLNADQSLQLRAASGARPVIRLIDWQTDMPDALSIQMEAGSRLSLDGLLITGRPLHVSGPKEARTPAQDCAAELLIRHCTLVPGWGIDCDCEPRRPAEPSLEIYNLRARVQIERSIVGSIQIQQDEVGSDPIAVEIEDSIIDAAGSEREAIGAPAAAAAHIALTIRRSTVFGIVEVHAVELGENCIFLHCVNVARRQIGCLRYCYVPPGCRTPRRYRCQPDEVAEAVRQRVADPVQRQREIANERLRVRPQFTAERYGQPAYAQLGVDCAAEIRRGADDESEMGAYHHLYQPQREANLRARLAEYTPAGMSVGIAFVN